MWMLWLSLVVSNNNILWKKETTFLQREAEYKKIYVGGQYYSGTPVAMADKVVEVIATDQGRRTTRCRIIKDATGKVKNTKGNPYEDMKASYEKFVKPVRTILQKRAGSKFAIPAISHNGYDLFVQTTDKAYTSMCTKQLEEMVKKADKPILMCMYMHPRAGAKQAHALAAIYYPKEYCQDTQTPEFHILSTYVSDEVERNNIVTMVPHVFEPVTKGGRKTRRRNMSKKRTQKRKGLGL